MKESKNYTKEEVIACIQENPALKLKDFKLGNGVISSYYIIKTFGTWREARKAAGLEMLYKKGELSKSKEEDDRPTSVYLIEFDKFYKIGVTRQKLKDRHRKLPVPYKVLILLEDLPRHEALKIEKYWLNNIKPFQGSPLLEELKYYDGKSECFVF